MRAATWRSRSISSAYRRRSSAAARSPSVHGWDWSRTSSFHAANEALGRRRIEWSRSTGLAGSPPQVTVLTISGLNQRMRRRGRPGNANVSRPLATSLASTAAGNCVARDAVENVLVRSSSHLAISWMKAGGGVRPAVTGSPVPCTTATPSASTSRSSSELRASRLSSTLSVASSCVRMVSESVEAAA